MRRNGLAILAVVMTMPAAAYAGPTEAVPDPTPNTCDWRTAPRHVHAGKADVKRAFTGPEKLRREKAWQEHKFCLYRQHDRDLIASYAADQRRAMRRREKQSAFLAAVTPPGLGVLYAIRNCESGSSGLYLANTGNGFYGGYQFDLRTWYSVGGSGLPSDASPREQDRRAALLYRRSGAGPWPVCGV